MWLYCRKDKPAYSMQQDGVTWKLCSGLMRMERILTSEIRCVGSGIMLIWFVMFLQYHFVMCIWMHWLTLAAKSALWWYGVTVGISNLHVWCKSKRSLGRYGVASCELSGHQHQRWGMLQLKRHHVVLCSAVCRSLFIVWIRIHCRHWLWC